MEELMRVVIGRDVVVEGEGGVEIVHITPGS